MKTSTAALIIFLAAGLIAPLAPADAREKKQGSVCSLCGRKIAEEDRKFGVVMPKVPGMEASSFDDAGCAVVLRNKECASRQSTFDANAYAHDYETTGRVPVEKAFFVAESGVRTPMGHGIIAFDDKARAEAFITKHGRGRLFKWYQAVDLPLKN